MAYVRRYRARKNLAEGNPTAGMRDWPGAGGLQFVIMIEGTTVVLTHVERDAIIAKWEEFENEYEGRQAAIRDHQIES